MSINYKKIHFIGIGGIGVSAVAKMAAQFKRIVTGSDLSDSEIIKDLREAGIKISIGHKAENLDKKTELVVYSPAINRDNPERKRASELRIKQMSYPEFLAEIGKNKFTLAVSRTHGKSTVTALLGLFFEGANFDPLVVVGSKVKTFKDGNLRLGNGKCFVVEACEHQENMLKIQPKTIVLTNLEEDHLRPSQNFHFPLILDLASALT